MKEAFRLFFGILTLLCIIVCVGLMVLGTIGNAIYLFGDAKIRHQWLPSLVLFASIVGCLFFCWIFTKISDW